MAKKKEIAQPVTTGIFDRLQWGESYTSLILGLIIVVVASLLVVSFIKNRNSMQQPVHQVVTQEVAKAQIQEQNKKTGTQVMPSTYTTVSGDTLWKISEKMYKSGYNWVDIAKANHLENPNIIHSGVKLEIPKIEAKIIPATRTVEASGPMQITAIRQNKYIVIEGDCLWNIAIRAYGDGYRWVDIVKANHLENPNIIHSGNNLIIPR